MELHEEIERIETREDLVRFVDHLLEDLESNREDWENPTLELFLDGLSMQIDGMDSLYRNLGKESPVKPSWRLFADMLCGAKMHE